jgi:hypothetical protein
MKVKKKRKEGKRGSISECQNISLFILVNKELMNQV